ncbi:MAG: hypothetical protein V4819_21760 [Verrucomicrobiota bacterium]
MTKPIGFDNWLSHNFIFDSTGRDFTIIGSFIFNDSGTYRLFRGPSITATTAASPCVVTTGEAHGFHTGQTVRLRGLPGALGGILDGEHDINVLSATTFSVPVSTVGSGASGAVGAIAGVDCDFRIPAAGCAYIPGKNCVAAHGDAWDRAWIG